MEKPHRILVIDDNPAIHEDFRKVLCVDRRVSKLEALESNILGCSSSSKSQRQFEIDSAFQGREGLARVLHAIQEGHPYEMAFVDVRMPPGWDGVEVTPRLWAADPELQIVLCTAYSDYTWEEMFEKLGTSDRMLILKKPFDRDELLQITHTLVAKRRLARMRHAKAPATPSSEKGFSTEQFQTEILRLRSAGKNSNVQKSLS